MRIVFIYKILFPHILLNITTLLFLMYLFIVFLSATIICITFSNLFLIAKPYTKIFKIELFCLLSEKLLGYFGNKIKYSCLNFVIYYSIFITLKTIINEYESWNYICVTTHNEGIILNNNIEIK